VPSERYSVEEQSTEYCGCACCVSDIMRGDLRSETHGSNSKLPSKNLARQCCSGVKGFTFSLETRR
jgi:hypothetical protein